MSDVLNGALNAAGTQTSGADVYVTGRTVHSRLDTLYVGLPGPVGPPVGVADLDAEGDTLIAILTLCHLVAPPPVGGKSLFV